MKVFGHNLKTEESALKVFLIENDYSFKNVCFLENFHFLPSCLEYNLHFDNCIFKTQLSLGEPWPDDTLETKAKLPEIGFKDCKLSSVLIIDCSRFQEVTFLNTKLVEFIVNSDSKLPKELSFWGTSLVSSLYFSFVNLPNQVIMHLQGVNYIEFDQVINEGFLGLYIHDQVKKITIEDFRNKGEIELYGLKYPERGGFFSLRYSDFGKCKLENCNFSTFSNFYFVSNNTNDVHANNVIWSKKLFKDPDDDKKEHAKLCGFYYSQVRKSVEDFDSYEAQEFNKLYLSELTKYTNLKDKILLSLSSLVSSHGTNWFKPLLWLVIVNFIFFFLKTDQIHGADLQIKDVTVMLNPVHLIEHYSFSKNAGVIVSSTFYLLDILLRAINATLLYHQVKAFRRFN